MRWKSAPHPFLGREAALASALRTLEGERGLFVLHGPPGVGKTTLAKRIATARSESCRVVWVDLDGVGDEGAFLEAMSNALGASPRAHDRATAIARIEERLATEPTLLVLDEMERAVAVVASSACDWLDAVADLSVLCVSRERTSIAGEIAIRVGPLSVADGARLLHLHLAREDRTLDEETVRRIVERLEGHPLAIELTAARIALFGEEGAPPAALGAAVEESLALVGDVAREAFVALSILSTPFSVGTAAAIIGVSAAEAETLLARLARASLISDGFRILGVLRAHVARRVSDEVRERHAARFLGQANAPFEELLAAFAWLSDKSDPRAADLAVVLDPMLVARSSQDVHTRIIERALELARGRPAIECDLLRARARILGLRGAASRAQALLLEALAIAESIGDERRAGWSAALACFVTRMLGRSEEALAHGDRAIACAAGDDVLLATAHMMRGLVDLDAKRWGPAIEAFRRARALAAMTRSTRLEGLALANLAGAFQESAYPVRARVALEEATACFVRSGDAFHLARMVTTDAAILRLEGSLDEAERRLFEGLGTIQEHGDLPGELEVRCELAEIAIARGDALLADLRVDDAVALLPLLEDARRERETRDLERRAGALEAAEARIELSRDGASCKVDGRTINLSRRPSLRRIVVALASQRTLSAVEVLEAGWPGERMRAESGASRVYMAIRRLRALGFERVLVTSDAGYAFDPRARIVIC